MAGKRLSVVIDADTRGFQKSVKSMQDSMKSATGNVTKSTKGLTGAFSNTVGAIGKVAGAVGIFKLVDGAVNMVTGSLGNAISRFDTLNNAQGVFENIGFGAKETARMMDSLTESLDGLPTASNDAVKGIQQISMANNDIEEAGKLFEHLNYAVLATGGSQEEVNRAVTMYSRALDKGKMSGNEFNTLQETMGTTMNVVAEKMGMSTAELRDGLSKGTVSMDDFGKVLHEVAENGHGDFASLEKQARDMTSGIGTAMDNFGNRVAEGIRSGLIIPLDEALEQNGLPTIADIINMASSGIRDSLKSMAPYIESGVEHFAKMVDVVRDIDFKGIISDVGEFLEKWSPLLIGIIAGIGAFEGIAKSIEPAQKAFSTLKDGADNLQIMFMLLKDGGISGLLSGFNPLAVKIVAVAAVIGALVAAGVWLYQNWDTVKEKAGQLGERISEVWDNIKEWTSETWESITEYLMEIWEPFGEFFSELWADISEIFMVVWEPLKELWTDMVEYLTELWGEMSEFFSELWGEVSEVTLELWEVVKDYLIDVWEAILDIAMPIFEGISEAITIAWELIKEVTLIVWSAIKEQLKTTWEFIKELAKPIFEGIMTVVKSAWEIIKAITTTVWEVIKGVIKTIWSIIKGDTEGATEGIKSIIKAVWDGIKRITKAVWDGIKGYLSAVWDLIKTVVSSGINAVRSTISTVWDAVSSITSSVWSAISSYISTVWSTITSVVRGAVTGVGSVMSSTWNSVLSVTRGVWNSIKTAITSPINAARSAVSSSINKIKSAMNFNWSIPKPRMPKFSLSGKFSLKPPSVPKIGLSWHESGGIFKGSRDGTVVGLAENHGDEAIVPLSNKTRMKPFAGAISAMLDKDRDDDNGGKGGDTVITGNTFVVREDADIKKIAQELKRLDDRESRAKGRRAR